MNYWFKFLPAVCLVLSSAICPASISAQVQMQRTCETPLIRAIQSRDVQKALQIIRLRGDLNTRACQEATTALIEAISDGMEEIAHALISHGADVNLSDAKHVSPLMAAAFYCRLGLASALLHDGANVNAVDSDGLSPLIYAANSCKEGELTALLLRSGAKVNVVDNDGETALMVAVIRGDEFAVKELVAGGADLATRFTG